MDTYIYHVWRTADFAAASPLIRDIEAPLLDRGEPDHLVEAVERFGPAKRPN